MDFNHPTLIFGRFKNKMNTTHFQIHVLSDASDNEAFNQNCIFHFHCSILYGVYRCVLCYCGNFCIFFREKLYNRPEFLSKEVSCSEKSSLQMPGCSGPFVLNGMPEDVDTTTRMRNRPSKHWGEYRREIISTTPD